MAAPHTKTFDWTSHRQKRVRYMMAQGETMRDIARSLGCNVSTLQRYLDRPAPVEDNHTPQARRT